MIEVIDNAVQLMVVLLCFFICIILERRHKNPLWGFLALVYSAYALGDLFWALYIFFYRRLPQYSYISEFSWYAAYLFLLLLIWQLQDDQTRQVKRRAFWLIPVFTFAHCFYYMQWGDYLGNIITAILMSMLIFRSLQGLLKEKTQACGKKHFYYTVLLFCLLEYVIWTSSCIFSGDTLANPYFWFDFALTLCMAAFLPQLGKVETA